MSKNNEKALVPKIRFPEFLSNGNWKDLTLGKIGEPLMCKRIFKEETTPTSNNGIPFYKIGTFGRLADSYIPKEIYEEYKNKYSFPKIGDILISASGTIGRLVIYDGSPAYFQDSNIIWLGHNEDLISNSFLYYSYSNLRWQTSDGGIISRLYNSDFKRMEICFPHDKNEQKKIAACLSSLDEVIANETLKFDILNNYKKGLLQNLLPQEGASIPNFRFGQLEISGEWKETTLTQIAEYENGKAHEQDIDETGDFIVVNSKFISQDGEVKKFTNTALCPATKGDILMVLSDIPNGKAFAKCFLVEEDNRYTVNQRICRITPHNINSKILYYLLNRNSYFLTFNDGVKQTNLRKEDVLNCPLMIPSDPQEQEMIADTLSSIDDLINAQNQKLEALQLHKKGLLQGLFPNINEVIE
jgi:type I restriction enzyme S subunit